VGGLADAKPVAVVEVAQAALVRASGMGTIRAALGAQAYFGRLMVTCMVLAEEVE
jgi:hypothetical protein